ncbi:uncharacterized protein A4U43_C08F17980 [Asparagus officinalis]|nr:uncharacterized protein A4U43_C08F17980 [Asparagus officinalis]
MVGLDGSKEMMEAYAFAVFADQQSAVTAMQSLNGLVFDIENESILHVDFAKANSRSKRLRSDTSVPYSPDKRIRETVAYSRSYLDSGVGSNIHMPGMGNSAYSTKGYPSTQSQPIYDYGTDANKPLNISSSNYIPQNTNPCSTLFVANLGPTCSEQELTEVFSRCPGFLKLKLQRKKGLPVAFVDFKDVPSSTGALNHLQGTILYSSVGEGMHLEYAKSQMGQPGRDKRA